MFVDINNKNFNTITNSTSNQTSENNDFRKLSINNNNNNGDILANNINNNNNKNPSNYSCITSQRQQNLTQDDEDYQMASINTNSLNAAHKYPLNKTNSLQSNINYNSNINTNNNNQINNNANNYNTLNNVQSNGVNKSKFKFLVIFKT